MPDIHDERATINWYRSPLPRETLQALNARSDLKGLIQAGGYLLTLCCTGAATLWSAFAGHWVLAVVLLFVHGTCGSFLLNAIHELCHNTVFKTKWLGGLFIRIFGFLGWNDWVWFNASHANHHRYTLHPPRDGEVVLPYEYASWKTFWKSAIWAPLGPYNLIRNAVPRALGIIKDEWTLALFPEDKPDARRRLFNWNRFLLLGHGLIFAASVTAAVRTGQWAWLMVPVVVSFSDCFGGWLLYLCNNTQHVGLTDKVPDFRICCRSVKLPGFASFLYWRMEYHIEHHMYAAVPCYNLPKLQKAIAHDLPERKGLVAAWKEIGMIVKKQAEDPNYQFIQTLPPDSEPARMGDREHEIEAGQAPPIANDDCDDLNPAESVTQNVA